ncbi:MAG TPA: tetratricopeptide repeat protein [Longimicrobium sp.]|jgi:hypothetical protein
MPPHPALARAKLLMERGRWAMAAGELRRALHDEPDDALLHAYLALCLVEDPARLDEAQEEALWSTAKDPLQPLAWYAASYVAARRGNGPMAEDAARVALSLSAESTPLLAHMASLMLAQGRVKAALETAGHGLAVDPDHVGCLLAAGTALSRKGRHDEAQAALARALEREPEDAGVHARVGWALLRRGDAAGAVRHFRESLRLDPTREEERGGLMEALKARNPVYRALLRAWLRLPWVPPSLKWLAVVAGMLAVIGILMLEMEGLPTWIALPLEVAVVAAVLLTWTAGPLFDLLLFGDPLGRHALTPTQRAGAVAMAATLLAAAAVAVAALATGEGLFGFTAALLALYTVPIAATLRARPGRARALTAAYTLLLVVPAAMFVTLQARGAGDPAVWFGIACGGMAFSDLVSDQFSGRI